MRNRRAGRKCCRWCGRDDESGAYVAEPWQSLRVGELVRIVRIPGHSVLGYHLHRDTRRLYKRLIDRKRPVRVYEIDKDGLPWIKCRFRYKNGRWDYHFLAINDDSWVRV